MADGDRLEAQADADPDADAHRPLGALLLGGDPMTAVPAYTGRHRPADTTADGRRLIAEADRKPAGWTPLADDVRHATAPTHYATATTAVMPALEATR